jgi:hypothetical protein
VGRTGWRAAGGAENKLADPAGRGTADPPPHSCPGVVERQGAVPTPTLLGALGGGTEDVWKDPSGTEELRAPVCTRALLE